MNQALHDDTRRAFLRGSTAAAAVGLASAFGPTPAGAAGGLPGAGLKLPSLYPGGNAANFRVILGHENTHVHYLLDALGSAANPIPTFPPLAIEADDPVLFASYASVLENTGVGAYLGALPYIYDPSYREAAASIALVESYHSGSLNSLVNISLTPGAFSFLQPFTFQQVLQNAAPYFPNVTLTPYSTTPSPQNDLLILNLALTLEYLEFAFYATNVPIFFP